jgi:hypothetical protein
LTSGYFKYEKKHTGIALVTAKILKNWNFKYSIYKLKPFNLHYSLTIFANLLYLCKIYIHGYFSLPEMPREPNYKKRRDQQ